MNKKNKFSYGLAVSTLGVVYGDIGTSPLYAFREVLRHTALNPIAILGILSLIFWSLVFIISIKYLAIIFRADNNGEGGILALLALLKRKNSKFKPLFYLMAIFGVGLLLGDGMLTPAISITAAVEGISTISPKLSPYIFFLACTILFFIFIMQSKGAKKLSTVFGPLIIIWFVTIAILGLSAIIQNPIVLKALNPYYAIAFFSMTGWHSFFVLGAVFLVVTGGEVLYADIGQFGKKPIRYSWFTLVFPSLVLNYFGQGAYLLNHPHAMSNPFYMLTPEWFSVSLLIIAIIATVVASQAIISATFALIQQAILLGFCPRIPVVYTSTERHNQIYLPQINLLLAIGSFFLLFTFQTSSNLAHAYGIAVNFYMLLTTTMIAYTALHVWKWPTLRVSGVFGIFLVIDLIFLVGNSHKFFTGGWIPILFAGLVTFVLYSWNFGLNSLRKNYHLSKKDFSKILKQLNYKTLKHLQGVTSIFITDIYDKSGASFLHFLKLSMAVPEHVLIVNYTVENIPYVQEEDQYEITCLNEKVCQLTLHYGFMDFISVPTALEVANKNGLLPFPVNINSTSYIVGIPNIIASEKRKTLFFDFQEKLFVFLMRNYSANLNIEFYNLPYNKTIAIGSYYFV